MSEPIQVGRVIYAPGYLGISGCGEIDVTPGRVGTLWMTPPTTLKCNGVTYTMADVERILREHEERKRGL